MSRKPREPAWQPALYEVADIYAVRALNKGDATPEQQQRALKWIIDGAAQFREQPFRSEADGGERETAFALGRQQVGREIMKALTLPDELLGKIGKNG